jgi:hypothetical protein
MAEELNDQERRELERWRSGSLRKSWPVVESVPDGLRYAAELARAQGTEGGDEHDELLRQAAIRLRDMNDAARVLIADRDLLLWLHAEAAWWLQLDRDEHESAEILHMWSKRVAYLEARVGELHNTIGELRAAIADIDAHATPVGLLHNDDPEGSPHHYLLTVGALHRALGKAYTAEPCEAERSRLRVELERSEASRQAWAEEAMRVQEQVHQLLGLLDCVHDDDSCWFDHHGGCQAHGFLDLKSGEVCPQREIGEVLKAAASGENGWSRPQCAVHPEGGPA